MTYKEAEKFVLRSFGKLLVMGDGPAGRHSFLFVYNTLPDGTKEGVYVSGAVNRIIDRLVSGDNL